MECVGIRNYVYGIFQGHQYLYSYAWTGGMLNFVQRTQSIRSINLAALLKCQVTIENSRMHCSFTEVNMTSDVSFSNLIGITVTNTYKSYCFRGKVVIYSLAFDLSFPFALTSLCHNLTYSSINNNTSFGFFVIKKVYITHLWNWIRYHQVF